MSRLSAALAAAVSVCGLAGPGSPQDGGQDVQLVPKFRLAVVPNLGSGDVSVLDTVDNDEVARIQIGPQAAFVAMSPDGQYAYVGQRGLGPTPIVISQIDLEQLAVTNAVVLNDDSHLPRTSGTKPGRGAFPSPPGPRSSPS